MSRKSASSEESFPRFERRAAKDQAFLWPGRLARRGGGSLLRAAARRLARRGRSGLDLRRRRGLLEPALDVSQGLGDFLRLGLEVFSEHIEASSDDTGDHPYNHQETKQCRHRGARVPDRISVTEYPSRTGRQCDPKTRPVLYSQATSWMIRHGAVSMGNSARVVCLSAALAAILAPDR